MADALRVSIIEDDVFAEEVLLIGVLRAGVVERGYVLIVALNSAIIALLPVAPEVVTVIGGEVYGIPRLVMAVAIAAICMVLRMRGVVPENYEITSYVVSIVTSKDCIK